MENIFRLFLLMLICFAISNSVVYQQYPPRCDVVAAQQCEYEQLICQLFTGPADDPKTVCRCGAEFYGKCLRLAGVSSIVFSILSLLNAYLNFKTIVWNSYSSWGTDRSRDLYENLYWFNYQVWLRKFYDLRHELCVWYPNWYGNLQNNSFQQLWGILSKNSNMQKQS